MSPSGGVAGGAATSSEAIAVTVLGPSGAGLAEAEVWLVDPASVNPERAVVASRTLGDWVEASRTMAAATASTDDRGVAFLPGARPQGFLVAARSGALFGLTEQRQEARGGEEVVLNLVARRSYRVELQDADGAPAAGVQITLAAPDPGTPDQPYMLPSTAITDADGTATLFEPPAAATSVLEGLDQIPERLAILRVPCRGLDPISLRDDGEPTTSSLPPLGQLQLACRHSAFTQTHWSGLVQVFPAADGSRSSRTLAQPLVGGALDLPYVSLEEDLRAVVVISEASAPERFIGTMTVELDAPSDSSQEGTLRRMELPLESGLILTGRCVDASGAALAEETIDLFVVGDGNASWTLVTDVEGRFRWLLLRPGAPLAKIVIGARLERGAEDLRATQRLGDVAAGQMVDLGVLTLE